jgi:uncharacterized RDD family membrane protein YckC
MSSVSYPPDPNNPYGPPPPQNPQGDQDPQGGQDLQKARYAQGAQHPQGAEYPQGTQNPQTPQGTQNNPYGQPSQPAQQPPAGYGYPQQPAPSAPGYGHPQAGQSPYAQPYGGAYGYPQQPGYPGVAGATPTGYVDVPGRGPTLLANGGQRVGARIIDTVIVYAVIIVLYIMFGVGLIAASSTGDPSATGGIAAGGLALFFLAMFALVVLYEVVTTATMGATLGKKILGLSVVNSRNGQRPGFGACLLRWGFPAVVGMFTCGLGQLLILLSPFFDNTGKLQGWHDKAANTFVVKT